MRFAPSRCAAPFLLATGKEEELEKQRGDSDWSLVVIARLRRQSGTTTTMMMVMVVVEIGIGGQ